MNKARCRHCGRDKVNRPLGLCWTCYYRPGVREQYPTLSRFANRGIGDEYKPVVRPPRRTDALPGTPEKLAVIAERVRMGWTVDHPDDPCLAPKPKELQAPTGKCVLDLDKE